jgi:hypothetical protein
MASDNLIRQDFNWFTGVVEDNLDPEQLGRVRVRCFGYHTERKDFIPTDKLPWAQVMMPVTSASQSGVGETPLGLVRGSWVVGFFQDGASAQHPIVMGTLAGKTSGVNYEVGFSDPTQQYPLADKLDQTDMPEEATDAYKESFSYKKKDEFRTSLDPIKTAMADTWELPAVATIIKPQYPKNHVKAGERTVPIVPVTAGSSKATGVLEDKETENFEGGSGLTPEKSMHVEEFDDTPGFERTSRMHKSGTYHEVTAEGNDTTVIVGDQFEIVVKDKNVAVKGNCNLTVDGNARTLIEGDHFVHVKGNRTELIEGTLTQTVLKDVTEDYRLNHVIDIGVDRTETIQNVLNQTVKGNVFETYDADQTLIIGGNVSEMVIGGVDETIGINKTENIIGNAELTIVGSRLESVLLDVTAIYGANATTSVAGNMGISLLGGGSSFHISSILGSQFDFNGTYGITLDGPNAAGVGAAPLGMVAVAGIEFPTWANDVVALITELAAQIAQCCAGAEIPDLTPIIQEHFGINVSVEALNITKKAGKPWAEPETGTWPTLSEKRVTVYSSLDADRIYYAENAIPTSTSPSVASGETISLTTLPVTLLIKAGTTDGVVMSDPVAYYYIENPFDLSDASAIPEDFGVEVSVQDIDWVWRRTIDLVDDYDNPPLENFGIDVSVQDITWAHMQTFVLEDSYGNPPLEDFGVEVSVQAITWQDINIIPI